MPPDLLEFEEPIGGLLKEIEALSLLPPAPERQRSIERLQQRVESIRADLYSKLTSWQRVLVARHPNRPDVLDYVERLFTEFTEISGDRRFADDHAIVAGFARYQGEPVMVIGHHKGGGGDTKQKVYRNFGYAKPEGYRKALRAMKLGEKFGKPVVCLVDTPGAYPGLGAEERGQAEAIARNLREMAELRVPILVAVTGEGGSGGALGISVGDSILMLEYAIYSVISPEGCASILWRSTAKAPEAAEALGLTAQTLKRLELIDEIVPEPVGGAHRSPAEMAETLREALTRELQRLRQIPIEDLLEQRYRKFRRMGVFEEG